MFIASFEQLQFYILRGSTLKTPIFQRGYTYTNGDEAYRVHDTVRTSSILKRKSFYLVLS
jgi:hypothetical protein